MKKKEREREKETSRNRSDARAYITRGPSATFTDSSSRFLSSERERERREASKAILSIDIDEKRITYLKYTREHVTRSPTVSWKVLRYPSSIRVVTILSLRHGGEQWKLLEDKISKERDWYIRKFHPVSFSFFSEQKRYKLYHNRAATIISYFVVPLHRA